MSYRFYPERVANIKSSKEVAGIPLIIPVEGVDGTRLTIPRLTFLCGATAQSVKVLQVEDFLQIGDVKAPLKTVKVLGLEDDLTGRLIALETEEDRWFISKISTEVGGLCTLEGELTNVQIKKGGRLLIFQKNTDDTLQSFNLEADKETILEAPAPGIIIADDYSWPLILYVSNESDPVSFLGGLAVYINR